VRRSLWNARQFESEACSGHESSPLEIGVLRAVNDDRFWFRESP
jgi:hypothetical protein